MINGDEAYTHRLEAKPLLSLQLGAMSDFKFDFNFDVASTPFTFGGDNSTAKESDEKQQQQQQEQQQPAAGLAGLSLEPQETLGNQLTLRCFVDWPRRECTVMNIGDKNTLGDLMSVCAKAVDLVVPDLQRYQLKVLQLSGAPNIVYSPPYAPRAVAVGKITWNAPPKPIPTVGFGGTAQADPAAAKEVKLQAKVVEHFSQFKDKDLASLGITNHSSLFWVAPPDVRRWVKDAAVKVNLLKKHA